MSHVDGHVEPELLYTMISRSAEQVFGTMLGMELSLKAARHGETELEAENGVVAFIGFAGEWVGTGRVSCRAQLACKIAGALFGQDYQSVDENVLDAVGETTNMVLGGVKNELEEHLGPMLLSIPTVIHGRNFTTRSMGKHDWVRVTMECAGEEFEIKLSLSREEQPERGKHTANRPFSLHI